MVDCGVRRIDILIMTNIIRGAWPSGDGGSLLRQTRRKL